MRNRQVLLLVVLFAAHSALADSMAFVNVNVIPMTGNEVLPADLVLLDADPLSAIGNTRRIHGVMLKGRWLSRTDLDDLLAGFEY